jgi:hypothetical protein
VSEARNAHWYTLAEDRSWPIEETATLLTDLGQRLPSDLLVDARIRWTSGDLQARFAAIAGIVVTPQVVSLVGVGCSDPLRRTSELGAGPAGTVPLFAVTIPQPVPIHQMIPISPLRDGVGGWVVFGSGVRHRVFRGNFSTIPQAYLCPQAARAYLPPTVPSAGILAAENSLQGLILLEGVAPLLVDVETVTIDDTERRAIVFRLDQESLTEEAVLDLTGPCGRRPEAGNCERPALEKIANVGPDCDGKVSIVFSDDGCLVPSQLFANVLGISCDVPVSSVCVKRDVFPNSDGIFEENIVGQDECDPPEMAPPIFQAEAPPVPLAAPVNTGPAADPAPAGFFSLSETDDRYEVRQGEFGYAYDLETGLYSLRFFPTMSQPSGEILVDPAALPVWNKSWRGTFRFPSTDSTFAAPAAVHRNVLIGLLDEAGHLTRILIDVSHRQVLIQEQGLQDRKPRTVYRWTFSEEDWPIATKTDPFTMLVSTLRDGHETASLHLAVNDRSLVGLSTVAPLAGWYWPLPAGTCRWLLGAERSTLELRQLEAGP